MANFKEVILHPARLCETQGGDLAYVMGRVSFKAGRPMLVEHVGGIYLEHDLGGRVLTPGFAREFDIAHVYAEAVGE